MVDAFTLSEKYQNFGVLVQLTLNDAQKDARIRSYIEQFDADFAFVLFKKLLQDERSQELLSLPADFNPLVERFLEMQDQKWLSCLHHLRVRKYDAASNEAFQHFTRSEDLYQKRVRRGYICFAD